MGLLIDKYYTKHSDSIMHLSKNVPSDNNSCAVWSFCTAMEIPFEQASEFISITTNRKKNHGTNTRLLLKLLRSPQTIKDFFEKHIRELSQLEITNYYKLNGKMVPRKQTVGSFIKKHPKGVYYLLIKGAGHAICIRDGKIYDSQRRNNIKSRVKLGFEID